MSGIDWSKAPESATHFDSRQYVMPAFMRKSADGGAWEYLAPSGWKFYGPIPEDDIAKMTVRPASEEQCAHDYANKHGCPECGEASSPDWSGEGLPPVGIVCEHSTDENTADSEDGGWKKVEIVAHHQFHTDDYVCAIWVYGAEVSYSSEGEHFRPIRTPEQIAAESRESTIKRFMQIGDIYYCDAEKLYDAGARIVTEDKP